MQPCHVMLGLLLVLVVHLSAVSTSPSASLNVASDASKILTRLDQLAPVVSERVSSSGDAGNLDISDESDDVSNEFVIEEEENSSDVTSSPGDISESTIYDDKRTPPSGKRIIFTPWGGKRAFNPWGGKRAFNPWGGKRAFNPWGGKRAFNPWGGKRAFNPWGGKRKFNSDKPLHKKGFNPWGGKRAFNPWGGKRSVETGMDRQQ